MRPGRALLIGFLVIVEVAILASIVLVLQTSVGSSGGNLWGSWNWVGGQVEATAEQWLPLDSSLKSILVSNDVGKVTLRGADGEYGIKATLHAFGRDEDEARQRLDLVKLTVNSKGTETSVSARGPHQWSGQMPHANLEIVVPQGSDVDLDAGMGSIEVDDFTGSLRAEADMGSVDVQNLTGDLTVVAKMGSVTLDRMKIQDKLDVRANMGRVEFSGSLGQENVIETSMGSSKIDLVANHPALNLDAEWSMGRLDLGLEFSGEFSEHTARGVLGSGDPEGELRVKSNLGSVRIQ